MGSTPITLGPRGLFNGPRSGICTRGRYPLILGGDVMITKELAVHAAHGDFHDAIELGLPRNEAAEE